jgi:hypothetical protein
MVLAGSERWQGGTVEPEAERASSTRPAPPWVACRKASFSTAGIAATSHAETVTTTDAGGSPIPGVRLATAARPRRWAATSRSIVRLIALPRA